MNFTTTFELDQWAKWAEAENIDGRCINFVMSYSNELFNPDEDGNHICNPRSFVMFANVIAGIKDWDIPENIATINTIAKGCFKDDNGRFATMFTSFIRNKMHLLIQPKEMLENTWDTLEKKLVKTVFDDNGTYRPDIASLLSRRFSNYVNAWLDSDQKTPISKVKHRLVDFIDWHNADGYGMFNKDMLYSMIKSITSEHRRQTNDLLCEPKIAKILA